MDEQQAVRAGAVEVGEEGRRELPPVADSPAALQGL